jgi:hypothetical protein
MHSRTTGWSLSGRRRGVRAAFDVSAGVVLAAVALAISVPAAGADEIRLEAVPGQAELGTVEIQGLAAGAFNAALWQAGTLHLLPDSRHPLLAPRLAGAFRNIYAPSAVELPDGWRLFYGAWDGVHDSHDRIYSRWTEDFLDFGQARTDIEHGVFIHVCNVNVIRLPDGAYRMACTVYPDAGGHNKPALFTGPDGSTWNGTPAPYQPTKDNIIEIEGYASYEEADVNGMNVLFYDEGRLYLYFGNFREGIQVHRAVQIEGRRFRYEGLCLDVRRMVNDVKKFDSGDRPWYLMALHANRDRLWYALSNDGMNFEEPQKLMEHLDDADRYIVAAGWVVRDGRLLGVLYGAGEVGSLDRNRLFARWLQKRIVLTDGQGRRYEATRALGPDRQIISLQGQPDVKGRLEVFAEDGLTPLGEPLEVHLGAGRVYRLKGSQ